MRFHAPGRDFIALYALAYSGLFVGFMPLIMVLLPLKAAIVGVGGKAAMLSGVALGGAAVASIANIVFGALSDRTRRRTGTRRPWIVFGLALLLLSYAALHASHSPATLLAATALFQLALNMMFAPLLAMMADEVPDERKGLVAGVLGTAQPIGSLAAVLVTLPQVGGEGGRFLAVCLLFTAMIVPFLLWAREGPGAGEGEPPPPVRVRRRLDFGLAWTARMLLQVAGNGITTFGYYYLEGAGADGSGGGERTIVGAMVVATLAAVAITILTGRLSDRSGRRKPFLAVGTLAVTGGMVVMAGAGSWGVAVLGYGLALCGISAFLAVHAALSMQLLPSPEHRGRDLGVLNLTNTLPAMVAPLLAFGFAPDEGGYAAFLLTMAALALVGGGVAMAIRTEA